MATWCGCAPGYSRWCQPPQQHRHPPARAGRLRRLRRSCNAWACRDVVRFVTGRVGRALPVPRRLCADADCAFRNALRLATCRRLAAITSPVLMKEHDQLAAAARPVMGDLRRWTGTGRCLAVIAALGWLCIPAPCRAALRVTHGSSLPLPILNSEAGGEPLLSSSPACRYTSKMASAKLPGSADPATDGGG
jgi:hypothetical protein